MKKKFKKRTHEEQKSFADKISKNKFLESNTKPSLRIDTQRIEKEKPTPR